MVKVGRETDIVLYTRTGTKRGVHVEMRCITETPLVGLAISMAMLNKANLRLLIKMP